MLSERKVREALFAFDDLPEAEGDEHGRHGFEPDVVQDRKIRIVELGRFDLGSTQDDLETRFDMRKERARVHQLGKIEYCDIAGRERIGVECGVGVEPDFETIGAGYRTDCPASPIVKAEQRNVKSSVVHRCPFLECAAAQSALMIALVVLCSKYGSWEGGLCRFRANR